jgi:hypothetical protein
MELTMKTKQYREGRIDYKIQWHVYMDNGDNEVSHYFETIGNNQNANTEKALQVNVQLKEMRKKKL